MLRSVGRRRPSVEPLPLPHHLQTSRGRLSVINITAGRCRSSLP